LDNTVGFIRVFQHTSKYNRQGLLNQVVDQVVRKEDREEREKKEDQEKREDQEKKEDEDQVQRMSGYEESSSAKV
jgi:hypothetical protein